MASLFGDLPTAKHDASANTAFKRPMLAPPPSILRNKRSKGDNNDSSSGAGLSAPHAQASYSIFSAFGPIEDEYDPALPNEYDAAKKAQEEAVLEAEREARRAAEQREAERGASQHDSDEGTRGLGSTSGHGSAPGLGSDPGPGQAGPSGRPGGASVAMKLMKSMGWSEGEGLGKDRQGMATPIILQKTDKRTGIIVNAEPMEQPSASRPGVVFSGPPSKVLLLRNMVSPGQVDEGLEDEVAEEVSKFGQVNRVLIFEVEPGKVTPEQAVRIFVEMDRPETATKAVIALHNRFFDGKTISATFFDEERFERMDLAPRPEELQMS